MGILSTIGDLGIALGEGIYSVGEDLVYGAGRTAEGLNFFDSKRQVQIGIENDYLLKNIQNLFKYGVTAYNSPLSRLISTILKKYYDKLPEDVVRFLAKKAGVGGAYVIGRMIIGKTIAQKITVKIAQRIAVSAAYKQLAKKLGVSAGAGATGVGIPITLLMLQGVAQRASYASRRLRKSHPALWTTLRSNDGLDMLYFLVEKSMQNHLDLIDAANRKKPEWTRHIIELRKQIGKK